MNPSLYSVQGRQGMEEIDFYEKIQLQANFGHLLYCKIIIYLWYVSTKAVDWTIELDNNWFGLPRMFWTSMSWLVSEQMVVVLMADLETD